MDPNVEHEPFFDYFYIYLIILNVCILKSVHIK